MVNVYDEKKNIPSFCYALLALQNVFYLPHTMPSKLELCFWEMIYGAEEKIDFQEDQTYSWGWKITL